MKFALFLGCNIPARLIEYELSSRAILQKLGIELIDIPEFNCCGYPLKNSDLKAYIVSSARNLALAEKQNLNIITLCKCCFGSLKKADHVLKNSESLRGDINSILARENLKYEGNIGIKHFLSVLYHDIGIHSIREKITKPYKGLKIATHYGCHALRPSNITQFDDPVSPILFDRLVEVTGAESVDWPIKLECCGAPLLGINDELSIDITRKKLTEGKKAGADYLCVACPYCQLQFDTARNILSTQSNSDNSIPSILYSQLLELCMEIDRESIDDRLKSMSTYGY